jgi:hypothetical protein
MSILMTRSLFVAAALVFFAPGALVAGEYQRARDGKTMVWNNEPKRGDEAAWSGARDEEGYATGFGTLTWYKGQKEPVKSFGIPIPLTGSSKVYARYYGNMVRGKFNGPVNVHAAAQTAHALFVEGVRSSAWAPGRAASRMPGARDAVSKQKPAVESASVVPQSTSIENSAATEPAADKPPGTTETLPTPAPTESAKAKSRKKSEEVALPQSGETPVRGGQADRAGQADLIGSGMPEDAKPPSTEELAQATPAKRSQTDVSLSSLAGPPASLHAGPERSSSGPSRKEPVHSTEGRLTKEEVLELSDAEAHARGYSPNEYGRADPLYNSADEIWSVSYKSLDATTENGKRFSVTVDDKTKGIVFVPGK